MKTTIITIIQIVLNLLPHHLSVKINAVEKISQLTMSFITIHPHITIVIVLLLVTMNVVIAYLGEVKNQEVVMMQIEVIGMHIEILQRELKGNQVMVEKGT